MKRYLIVLLLAILGGALIVWGVTYASAQTPSRLPPAGVGGGNLKWSADPDAATPILTVDKQGYIRCNECEGVKYGTIIGKTQDVKAFVYRLTPEKSQEFAKLEATKRELERQWREVDTQQKYIRALAGIPESEMDRTPTAEGDHFVFYPKPTPAPTPETKKP